MIIGSARRYGRALVAPSIRLGIGLGSASIMAVALVCVPAAGAAPRPKPDLVVKAFKFESTPPHESNSIGHVVLGNDGHGQFGVAYKVKNVGERPAPKSVARIVLGAKVADEPVGPIPKGGQRTFRQSYDRKFHGPGGYEAFVCADFGDDVNESNEHNNCTPNVSVAAIPRRWNVGEFTTGPNSLTGIAPFFAAHSVGMTFDFYGIDIDNGQHYFLWLATGGVNGEVSGNDGFCSYEGHGAVSHSPWDAISPEVGYLEISPELNGYFAEVEDQSYTFTTTQTCPGYPPYDSEGGISILQTISSDGRVDQPMSDSATTLADSYNIPTGFGTGATVGQWSFKADLP
jgi:CARDB.